MTLYEFFKEEAEIMGKYANGELVEVVKCKDCKYFENQCDCVKHSADILGYVIEVTPDDYCSFGERKEDND